LNNYEQTLIDFSLDVPEYFNFGVNIIDTWAKKDRNKLANDLGEPEGRREKYGIPDL